MERGGVPSSLVGPVLVVVAKRSCSRLFGLQEIDRMDLEPHGLFSFAVMEKDFIEMRL